MITSFKDKNIKSKMKNKNYKMLTTILKSCDTFVIIVTRTISITLSLTGIGLIAIAKSSGITCGLTYSNKVLHEIIMQRYNK